MIFGPVQTERGAYESTVQTAQVGSTSLNSGQLTTVTASLSRDSPNTTIWSISFTWISSNTARTATGSTAEIREANTKQCSNSMFKAEMGSCAMSVISQIQNAPISFVRFSPPVSAVEVIKMIPSVCVSAPVLAHSRNNLTYGHKVYNRHWPWWYLRQVWGSRSKVPG